MGSVQEGERLPDPPLPSLPRADPREREAERQRDPCRRGRSRQIHTSRHRWQLIRTRGRRRDKGIQVLVVDPCEQQRWLGADGRSGLQQLGSSSRRHMTGLHVSPHMFLETRHVLATRKLAELESTRDHYEAMSKYAKVFSIHPDYLIKLPIFSTYFFWLITQFFLSTASCMKVTMAFTLTHQEHY